MSFVAMPFLLTGFSLKKERERDKEVLRPMKFFLKKISYLFHP